MKYNSGFTLIEVLIYSVIFVIAGGLLLNTLIVVTKVETNQSATVEVINQMDFVLQNIKRLVAQSSAIEVDGGEKKITLYMSTDAKNPTVIKYKPSQKIIQVQEGTGAWMDLTTSKVKVDNAIFAKRSNPGGFDAVEVSLTMSTDAAGSSRTVTTAIARANAATFDSSLTPNADNSLDLGAGGSRWKNGLFSGSVGVGISSVPSSASVSLEVGKGIKFTPGPEPSSCAGGAGGADYGLLWMKSGGGPGGVDTFEICTNQGWKPLNY